MGRIARGLYGAPPVTITHLPQPGRCVRQPGDEIGVGPGRRDQAPSRLPPLARSRAAPRRDAKSASPPASRRARGDHSSRCALDTASDMVAHPMVKCRRGDTMTRDQLCTQISGTYGTGRRSGDIADLSLGRNHAQSRAELESSRARVPYIAGCEFSFAPMMRTPALKLKSKSTLAAEVNGKRAAGNVSYNGRPWHGQAR